MATSDQYTVIGSLTPNRHALRFIGGNSDDGITVNALAAAMVAGNHTIGTVSAWVMMSDPTMGAAMTIFSAGVNASAAEIVEFSITTAGKLKFKVTDASVTRVDVSTTNRVIYPHRWYHVALVQDAIYPRIYVDGVKQDLTFATSTEVTQWFDDLDTIDNGAIGALYSNNAYTQEFLGYISDVWVWSGTTSASALTDAQILLNMNGATVASGLAHYNFDGTLLDDVTGGTTYQGTKVGDVIYCDANEFTSRFTFGAGIPVTADNVVIVANGSMALAYLIQAA